MGVRWWWGWEMRWHKGGSSTCLLSTWQELGSEELSQQLCSLTFPTCHSQPPALLWEVFILAKPSPHGRLLFSLICRASCTGKWDSRTSLDLLPTGHACPGASELWWADGAKENLGTSPSWYGQ